jgi:hypothetical protein
MPLCGAEIEYLHNTYVARGLQSMSLQFFYGKGPHFIISRFRDRTWKHNISGVRNRTNSCVVLIAYTQVMYSGYGVIPGDKEAGEWL